MWSLVKLTVNAVIESIVITAVITVTLFTALWAIYGVEIPVVVLVGACTMGITLTMKLGEFAILTRIVATRGRAFDSAYTKLYSALAERDVESARYWLHKLESRQQPLYNVLSDCSTWRGANTTAIDGLKWQVIDRVRVAREDIARTR